MSNDSDTQSSEGGGSKLPCFYVGSNVTLEANFCIIRGNRKKCIEELTRMDGHLSTKLELVYLPRSMAII